VERSNETKSHAQQLVELKEGRPLPEILHELFITQRMTRGAIGKRWGVTRQTVSTWIDEYGLDPQKAVA
jgi:DNA-binding transcriptional regulator LsrR (DeoR family)